MSDDPFTWWIQAGVLFFGVVIPVVVMSAVAVWYWLHEV